MRARLFILCFVSAAIVGASPWIGKPLEGEAGAFILQTLRIPRVLMAVLVGGTMSLVGACYQTIFANPLAAPSTASVSPGAISSTPSWNCTRPAYTRLTIRATSSASNA